MIKEKQIDLEKKQLKLVNKKQAYGWKKVKLGDVGIEIIDGDRGVNYPKKEDFFNRGYCLFLNTKNVTNSGFLFSEINFITEEKDKMLRKGKVRKNDVILTTRGTVGNVAFNNEKIPFQNLRINSGMVIIRPNGIDPQFNYQLFRYLKKDFLNFSSGSAQPQLPIRDMKNILIDLPPLKEQKAIAEVLSSLDDKVELLHQQNKTLEDLAQTLFRKYFIEEDNGINTVGRLKDILSLRSGYAFKGKDFVNFSSFKVIKIKNIKGKGIVDTVNTAFVNEQIIKLYKIKSYKLEIGDILLAMSGNTTGKIGMICDTDSNLYLNQRVGKFFIKDQLYRNFLYLFLMSGNFEEKILKMGYGSAQPNISPTQIENLKLIIPPKEKIILFNDSVSPVFKKIFHNQSQIKKLEKTRDTILPKLMNRKVKIKDI